MRSAKRGYDQMFNYDRKPTRGANGRGSSAAGHRELESPGDRAWREYQEIAARRGLQTPQPAQAPLPRTNGSSGATELPSSTRFEDIDLRDMYRTSANPHSSARDSDQPGNNAGSSQSTVKSDESAGGYETSLNRPSANSPIHVKGAGTVGMMKASKRNAKFVDYPTYLHWDEASSGSSQTTHTLTTAGTWYEIKNTGGAHLAVNTKEGYIGSIIVWGADLSCITVINANYSGDFLLSINQTFTTNVAGTFDWALELDDGSAIGSGRKITGGRLLCSVGAFTTVATTYWVSNAIQNVRFIMKSTAAGAVVTWNAADWNSVTLFKIGEC